MTKLSFAAIVFVLISVSNLISISHSFVSQPQQRQQWRQLNNGRPSLIIRNNVFQDMLDQAFANDRSLPKNRGEAQYDKPGEEFVEGDTSAGDLTDTQKQWRQKQLSNDVTTEMVQETTCQVDLFLAGVPSKDPSSDLYGSKVNISSRDKATGLTVPDKPTASVNIEFCKDGVCKAPESEFTTGERDGEWKLSDDGKMLRFSFDVLGYTRTVQTKGSIQKIYWSKEDEQTTQTSSSYSIPPGWVYADISVASGKQPGAYKFDGNGVLRVEKSMGLLGAASRMVACGNFQATKMED